MQVLTECPLIVVILLQLYKGIVQDHIIDFVPLIVAALQLQVPADIRTLAASVQTQEDPCLIKQVIM